MLTELIQRLCVVFCLQLRSCYGKERTAFYVHVAHAAEDSETTYPCGKISGKHKPRWLPSDVYLEGGLHVTGRLHDSLERSVDGHTNL